MAQIDERARTSVAAMRNVPSGSSCRLRVDPFDEAPCGETTAGNIETFPAIRSLARDLDRIISALIPPPGNQLDTDQELKRV
jgi:hypothetical protein